jgi:hypothetical protein
MLCTLILYPVNPEHFRINVRIGRRNLNYALTSVRFRTTFVNFKQKIINFITTGIKEEARNTEYPAAFGEAKLETVAAMESVCAGCGNNREMGNANPADMIVYKPFSIQTNSKGKKGGITVTNYWVLTLYYSFDSLQYLHVLLDSDRLQTEALLDLNRNRLKENLSSEINLFVSRNGIQVAENKEAIDLTLETIKEQLTGFEKKCKNGKISDIADEKEFHIECLGMEVVKFTDVESETDSAIRIDFLVNPSATTEVTEAGFILQKSNTFDQMEMVKKVIQTYIKGGTFNPGWFGI